VDLAPFFTGKRRRKKLALGEDKIVSMRQAARLRSRGGNKEDFEESVVQFRSALVETYNESVVKSLVDLDDPEVSRIMRRRTYHYRIPPLRGGGSETFGEICRAMVDNLRNRREFVRSAPEGFVPRVTLSELRKVVAMSPAGCAVGPDEAPTRLLKAMTAAVPERICQYFTDILRSGVHPRVGKRAWWCPYRKPTNPRCLTPRLGDLSTYCRSFRKPSRGSFTDAWKRR
jgi:hypothetical protein